MSGQSYLLVTVFLVAASVLALIPLLGARLWAQLVSPGKPGNLKNASYECGLESRGSAAIQFKAKYYLFGIMFLILDVEILFLLPFAVVFRDLPLGALLAMGLFLLLLIEGLAWAWARGILNWR